MTEEPSEREIQKMKTVLARIYGRQVSDQEATKAIWDLKRLAQLSIGILQEDTRRKDLLKASPKGFHLDKEGYSCLICGGSASNENSWYDKNGLKCMTCQRAINTKVIPGSIAKDKESWYDRAELEIYFNLKGAYLDSLIKQGFLKDRKIPGEKKRSHLQLFLLKDNKNTLPPKKLVRSRTVVGEKDGEQYYTLANWYEWADEKLARQISKYRIVEVLGRAFSQPLSGGRFYYKALNPLYTSKEPILRAEDIFKSGERFAA